MSVMFMLGEIVYRLYSIKACTSMMFMLGEIVYRLYSMYLLKQVAAHYEGDDIPAIPAEHPPVEIHLQNEAHGIHLQREEEAEYEDDDCFIRTSQETGHDPLKEEFCSGR